MVENEQMDQRIGNYSQSFTTQICHNQNIAEDIVGMGMLLRHQEKYV